MSHCLIFFKGDPVQKASSQENHTVLNKNTGDAAFSTDKKQKKKKKKTYNKTVKAMEIFNPCYHQCCMFLNL